MKNPISSNNKKSPKVTILISNGFFFIALISRFVSLEIT